MRRFWVALGLWIVTGVIAQGQPPAESRRAASLKAPQPLATEELPLVARGAVPDFPISAGGNLPSTPVKRAEAQMGPAWINGIDPNLLPVASRNTPPSSIAAQRPLPNPTGLAPSGHTPAGRSTTGLQPASLPAAGRWVDRILPPAGEPQLPAALFRLSPPVPAAKETPSATTAFRAVGNNGAPVYAGPPAYRWYGWGTVTPGANPLAPNGQYPRASANWYQITGATPGAFPVPVTSTGQPLPGIDPPSYGTVQQPGGVPSPNHSSPPAYSIQDFMETAASVEPPRRPALEESKESKFSPNTTVSLPPVPASATPPRVAVPTITPVTPPSTTHSIQPGPTSATTERLPPLATNSLTPPNAVAPPPVPSAGPEAKPAAPAIPAIPVIPQPMGHALAESTLPAGSPARPHPLPTSITTRPASQPVHAAGADLQWRPASERFAPGPGQWVPAPGEPPLPTQTKPSQAFPAQIPSLEAGPPSVVAPLGQPSAAPPVNPEPPTQWKSGSVTPPPTIARGQANDSWPDPIVAFVQQLCRGRAGEVDIRWTGPKKLRVCIEVPHATEAQQLVADISHQRELAPYQIDFYIVVK